MNTVNVTDLGDGSVQFSKVTTGEINVFVKVNTTWKSDVTYLTLIDTLTSNSYIYTWEELNAIYSPSDIESLFGTSALVPAVNLSFGTTNNVATENKLKSILIIHIKNEINGQPINNGITLSQISLGNDCGKVGEFYILVNPSFNNGGSPVYTDINTTNSYVEKGINELFLDTDNLGKVILTTMIRSYDTKVISQIQYLDLSFNTGDTIVIAGKTTGSSKGDFFASIIWKEFI